ncbi:MAG: hypothetical protein KC609_26990 [Myxococcales bacterium]|nr:hypothetical protein [Myxococcales bacterium]
MRTVGITVVGLLLLLAGGALLGGCGEKSQRVSSDGPTSFAVQNAIFSDVLEVTLAVQSQSGGRPALSWKATEQPYVIAAIFTNNVQIDKQSNSVSNTAEIVWLWHNGLQTGRDGAVKFSDGFDPRREAEGLYTLRPEYDPASLAPGTYVIALWALDRNGEPVAASREVVLTVD